MGHCQFWAWFLQFTQRVSTCLKSTIKTLDVKTIKMYLFIYFCIVADLQEQYLLNMKFSMAVYVESFPSFQSSFLRKKSFYNCFRRKNQTCFYQFKVNNKNTGTSSEIFPKLTIKTPVVVCPAWSLLLTLNIFYILFYC